VLRILLMRPGSTSALANLSVLPLNADNNPSPEVLLVPDIDPMFGVTCSGGLAACTFDSQGMIEVKSQTDGRLLVNPVTGDVQPEPPLGGFQSQPVAGQVSYFPQTATSGTVYQADGHAISIQLAPPPPYLSRFQGDDFYYVDPQHDLIDIPPTGAPEQVATGVTDFEFWDTTKGPLLLLSRMTADGSGTQSSIGDPRSGMATVLPFDAMTASLSPDERWVLGTDDQMNGQFGFFDRNSGALQTVDLGQPAWFSEWRPGTSEAWVMGQGESSDLNDAGTVWVLRPDAPPVSVPGINLAELSTALSTNGGYIGSSFTADGVYWFAATPTTDSGTKVVQVGAADDPTGPRYSFNPPGTSLSLAWYLPNGRFLTTNYANDFNRSDANLLDPRTGDNRLVGERGVMATVGQTRFMGIFHLDELRGDLVAGGFEDASPIELASEFTEGAFAEPQGADLLAPGTRIVYQFQARAASPYDGIWLTECP